MATKKLQKSSKTSKFSSTKTRTFPSQTSRQSRKTSKSSSSSPKINSRSIILTIIALAVAAVSFALIFTFFNRPERIITNRIESLTRHYYEDIFYETMLSSSQFSGDPEKSLAKYSDFGLSPISLEQLILANDTIDPSITTYFAEYCDLSRTSVTIYPESPYTKNSYHFSITYSCNF